MKETDTTGQPETQISPSKGISRRGFLAGAASLIGTSLGIDQVFGKKLRTPGTPLPAQAADNSRLFVPIVAKGTNLSGESVISSPFEQLLQVTNPAVESVPGINGGFSCLVESRATADALYKVIFEDQYEQTIANNIAFDARGLTAKNQGKGYNQTTIYTLKAEAQLPSAMQLNDFILDLSSYGLSNKENLGKLAISKQDTKLYLFLVATNMPLGNPGAMSEINKFFALDFFAVTSSGGSISADLSGRTGYLNLVQAQAIKIIAR